MTEAHFANVVEVSMWDALLRLELSISIQYHMKIELSFQKFESLERIGSCWPGVNRSMNLQKYDHSFDSKV